MPSLLVAVALLSGDGLAHVATQQQDPQKPFTATYPVEEERFRNLAIETYPASFAIGRYAIGIEYMFAEHHAATLSPHLIYAPLGNSDLYDGVGGELGYRYFFKTRHGPDGFFAGAAFTFGHYHYRDFADVGCGTRQCPLVFDLGHFRFGGALEAGYQTLVGPLLLGAGGGAEYRIDTERFVYEPIREKILDLLIGPGFRPRLFVTIGTAF